MCATNRARTAERRWPGPRVSSLLDSYCSRGRAGTALSAVGSRPMCKKPERVARAVTMLALASLLAVAVPPARSLAGDAVEQGIAALAAGDVGRARQLFAEAVSVDASRPLALAGLAATSLLAGRPEQSVASFASAAKLDSAAWAQACFGAALMAAGRFDDAVRPLQAAVAADPAWAALRARLAFVQWRQGLISAALENARLARNQGDRQFAPLVEAAILLAQGEPEMAWDAAKSACPAPFVRRPLLPEAFSPGAIVTASTPAEVAALPAPARAPEAIKFAWPHPGSKVTGNVEIRARCDVPLNYMTFYVDDQFVAVTNVAPYRALWDTRRWSDGVHRLRAEGFGPGGRRVVSREVQVIVANRKRTADTARLAADRRLGRILAELCLPVPQPQDLFILRGLAAAGAGHWRQALDDLEQGFARWPWSRPMRAALLAAYRDLGVSRPTAAEIHLLPSTREVAITFDDGPHPRITPFLLSVLARRSVRATFFLVGKQCLVYPELVRQIVAAGHEVASHSFTHANMRRLSELDIMRELAESRWAIRQACDRSVVLFRPPGGHYSPTVRAVCARMGFRPVFWTANICRYAGDPRDKIIAGLVADLADGGIVLLHNGEDETPLIIEELLDRLIAAGFKLGPVGELAGVPHPYFALEGPDGVRLAP